MPTLLNERAAELCERIIEQADSLGVHPTTTGCGTRIVDFGVHAAGGVQAGLKLAKVCLADLAQVSLVRATAEFDCQTAIQVQTDHPLAACMASQYAGWQVAADKYFAMASGPMRALGSREPLFEKINLRETADIAVGVLESRKLPPDDVCLQIARQCEVDPAQLTLLVAPTASLAGTVQVVARSVETALHKLLELGFDPARLVSGVGTAPLPPVASSDLAALGRTNDAILYGGEVTLWVRGDDASLEAIGLKVPSSASKDFGQPFAAIFERYDCNFYKIDPHLFSPATITFCNLDTGNSFRFGQIHPRIIHESFGIRRY